MKYKIVGNVLMCLTILILLFTNCNKKEVPKGNLLAKVNGGSLTLEEFNELLGPENKLILSPLEKQESVKQWVDREIVYQEAIKKRIDKDKDIARLIENNRKEIIVGKFLQREIGEKAVVLPQDVKAYFDAHIAEYRSEVKVGHILVHSETQANAILDSLRKGISFDSLAKRYSKDNVTAGQGGLFGGYLRRMDVPLKFGEVAFALPKDGISGVVKTEYGYHIIKLYDKKPVKDKIIFDNVKDQIQNMLLFAKQREVYDNWIAELKKNAKIDIHAELLK